MTRRRLSMIIRQRQWDGENKKPGLNCISSSQKQKIIIKKNDIINASDGGRRWREAEENKRKRRSSFEIDNFIK